MKLDNTEEAAPWQLTSRAWKTRALKAEAALEEAVKGLEAVLNYHQGRDPVNVWSTGNHMKDLARATLTTIRETKP